MTATARPVHELVPSTPDPDGCCRSWRCAHGCGFWAVDKTVQRPDGTQQIRRLVAAPGDASADHNGSFQLAVDLEVAGPAAMVALAHARAVVEPLPATAVGPQLLGELLAGVLGGLARRAGRPPRGGGGGGSR